jgi:hypothetical protein
MYGCVDLIGKPYRLGADGSDSDGAIDCIHMVYAALQDMGIPTPAFKASWYEATRRQIARDLLTWGRRIPKASYDGDILLLRQEHTIFAVAWSQGVLYINPVLEQVAWCRLEALLTYHAFRCSRSSVSLLQH